RPSVASHRLITGISTSPLTKSPLKTALRKARASKQGTEAWAADRARRRAAPSRRIGGKVLTVMRVVHVSPTDIDGGAAKGAYNLHGALRRAGVDSLMLVQRKYSDDPTVLPLNNSHPAVYDGLRDRLDRLPLKLLGWRRQSW